MNISELTLKTAKETEALIERRVSSAPYAFGLYQIDVGCMYDERVLREKQALVSSQQYIDYSEQGFKHYVGGLLSTKRQLTKAIEELEEGKLVSFTNNEVIALCENVCESIRRTGPSFYSDIYATLTEALCRQRALSKPREWRTDFEKRLASRTSIPREEIHAYYYSNFRKKGSPVEASA